MILAERISKVAIDPSGELRICTDNEEFHLAWKSHIAAKTEPKHRYLFSPKPADWTDCDWFLHMLSVVRSDCGVDLVLDGNTAWENVDESLMMAIWSRYSPVSDS